jgi:tryptophan synthase beta subunit
VIVKICGLTRPEDAAAATAAGADWLGLNFWPRSKRAVDRERARACARAARAAALAAGRSVALAGVFVNQDVAEVAALAAAVGLDFVQLHGDEPPEVARAVRAACHDAGCGPGVRIIRALALRAAADIDAALAHVAGGADVLLIDTPSAGYGGSGHTGDWALAAAMVTASRRPVILAGGLAAHNVAAAVAQVGPAGVDVASGVESAPGVKDTESMHAFVQAARAARRAGARARAQQQSSTEASMSEPNSAGRFGVYGGQYVAETLMPAVTELAEAYREARTDPAFQEELGRYLRDYVGRPSPLTFAPNLSREAGARVFLKREDLNHTGAHKINNCVGQALLARRMGKRRLIAETGAGQHGVATATVAAMLGMTCDVYMGAEDVARQSLNVFRMKLLGARVIPVEAGTRTLKDAMNEALRDWVTNVGHTYYLIGSVAGPHPYPIMVRDFQAVIGQEVRTQILTATGRLPDALVACVGGGSNAAGLFAPFVDDEGVAMFGVEAAGSGIESGRHAATLARGRVGVLHGSKSYVLCDEQGQITEAHSISAGLDYPGVGPEHAHWKDTGRVTYVSRTDDEALAGLQLLARTEGILCALETAHAVAALAEVARRVGPEGAVVLGLSGRGDKDMITVARHLGVDLGVNDPSQQHGPSGPDERTS